MSEQEMISALRLRLDEGEKAEERLLSSLLSDAAALIRALTWRSEVPPELQNAQIRLAVIFYNRMGMEGESSRSEGDVKRTAEDLPDGLRREIYAYRRALT